MDMSEAKDTAKMLSPRFHARRAAPARCLLALLLFAGVAIAQSGQGTTSRTSAAANLAVAAQPTAQTPPAPAASARPPAGSPAGSPKIAYVDGQLKIDAFDCTLADVLRKVAALTGVAIDIPPGANNEKMPVVELGPGPARQVLASLLSDTGFDFVIQASNTDPGKLQNVLLISKEKPGGPANSPAVVARVSPRPNARGAQPEDTPAPAQPEISPVETASVNPQPAASDPEPPPPPAQPSQLSQIPFQNNATKPFGNGAPPAVLNPQNISETLQQMYQQRMQMIQQGQTGQGTPPATYVAPNSIRQ
jgi:hypothetical protein